MQNFPGGPCLWVLRRATWLLRSKSFVVRTWGGPLCPCHLDAKMDPYWWISSNLSLEDGISEFCNRNSNPALADIVLRRKHLNISQSKGDSWRVAISNKTLLQPVDCQMSAISCHTCSGCSLSVIVLIVIFVLIVLIVIFIIIHLGKI